MQTIKIEAQCPAKINLTFDIKGRFEDGYHEVETVLQAVSLYDQLVFSCQLGKPFAVKVSAAGPALPEFPPTQENIIYKAAQAFCRNLPGGTDFDLEVVVNKNIPIGAGLGGASSNAAATLLALNAIFNNPLSNESLTNIARTLGADIPFFITGGLRLGTARGDKLQPLNPLPPLWIVLVKPRKISIQTKWAYAQFDKWEKSHGTADLPKPDWHAASNKLQPNKLGNVFEPVIFEHYPMLTQLKYTVESAGATCCHMTGSGSALYGLTISEEHANSVADKLSLSQESLDVDTYVVQGIEHGVLVL